MLKKEDLIAGSVYEVRSDRPLKNGLGSLAPTLNAPIGAITAHAGYVPGTHTFALNPGDLCELLHGPKKKNGVNVVLVKCLTSGQSGCVFWCEFRCNMMLLVPKLTTI